MKQRILSFDLLKLLAIYLVILGHSIQYFRSGDFGNNDFRSFIYIFHMPLFMMLSGMMTSDTIFNGQTMFVDYFWKRLKGLLIPMWSWGVISGIILLFYGTELVPSFTVDGVVNDYKVVEKYNLLIGIVCGRFWFIKSLLICLFSAFVIFKCGKFKYLILFLALLLSHYISYCQLNTLFISYVFGIFFYKLLKTLSKQIILMCGIVCFFTFIILFGHNSTSFFFRLLEGLTMSAALVSIFYYAHPLKNQHIINLSYLGQFTLGIYLLQSVLLEIILSRYLSFETMNDAFYNYLVCPFISMVILFMSLVVLSIMRKNNILSTLFLG